MKIVVPYQLTVVATSGSAISVCKERTYDSTYNPSAFTTISNCIYTEYLDNVTIEFTLPTTYTGITEYEFNVGYIRNPSSVIVPDSFIVSLSNGYPTGSLG